MLSTFQLDDDPLPFLVVDWMVVRNCHVLLGEIDDFMETFRTYLRLEALVTRTSIYQLRVVLRRIGLFAMLRRPLGLPVIREEAQIVISHIDFNLVVRCVRSSHQ